MAIQTTGTLSASIAWSQVDTNTYSRTTDSGSIACSLSIADGSGNSQANCIWTDTDTIPSGGTVQIDLLSLPRDIFGETATITFSRVRGLVFKNAETTAGRYFSIAATGLNAFTDPFAGGSGGMPVQPSCALPLFNSIAGYTVGTGNRYIYLEDTSGHGCSYSVALIGVSG